MEVRIGIKKSVWEKERKMEGYAVVDGVQKVLTPELLEELKVAKAAGKIKDYTRFWLNDNGNPLQSA
ncbi:MAG: hypothetical protein JRI54_00110 [Deltaproteobacteria bacterium]|nr:hypothetical protein [Deltaproteobacteria bacterium]